MATHSSILAWRILWTEEPGGLQSMESQRVFFLFFKVCYIIFKDHFPFTVIKKY